MQSLNIKYMPQLDHIRAYAALLVIFFHLINNTFVNAFHFEVGVDLFFTLSGFIFFLIAENTNATISYGKFIYNRFLRIYPLILVLFFLTIVIMRNHITVIDYLNVFGLNLIQNGKIKWISGDWGYQYLSFNWWTVGVEFIFYLTFPFIFQFYKQYGFKYLIQIVALVVLLRYGLYYTRVGEDGSDLLWIEINYSVFGHYDTFIAGMMSAYFYLNMPNSIRNWLTNKLVFILIMICTATFLYFSDDLNRLIYPTVVGFFCGATIVGYLIAFTNFTGRFARWLSYLGSISFSLYLLHSFVRDALHGTVFGVWLGKWFELTPQGSGFWVTLVIYLPLIIILSILTYSTIEKPFLNMRIAYFSRE